MELALDSVLRRVELHGAWRKEISSPMQVCITKALSLSALRNNTMLRIQTFSWDVHIQSQSIWPAGCPCSCWSFQLYVPMEYTTETTCAGHLLYVTCCMTCQTKPSSNLPPWPSNKLRSYRLTDTRGPWPLSRWSCQSSSFIIPGALGPLLARSVRRSPQVGGSDDQARRWTVLKWFVYRKTICSLRLKFIWDILNENRMHITYNSYFRKLNLKKSLMLLSWKIWSIYIYYIVFLWLSG